MKDEENYSKIVYLKKEVYSIEKIRCGIVGYGNLGKGVELAMRQNPDIELVGIFSRRKKEEVNTFGGKVFHVSEIESMKDRIDVMILCTGSATDLPKTGADFAKNFNTVDSFDTHANIPNYFEKMDQAAKEGNNVSIISVGWDPGLFSLNRVYFDTALPEGTTYTFWGKGVSQGHSDAIRRIEGVKDAIQYTIPIKEAIDKVKTGGNVSLTTREKHLRECFVVLEEKAESKRIESEIKTMKNYFDEYDTTIHFITEEELHRDHYKMTHGGFVIRSGKTGLDRKSKQIMEFSLHLDSNPEFTASVLIAYARAAFKIHKRGEYGAKTVLDVAPSLLSIKSNAELRKELL